MALGFINSRRTGKHFDLAKFTVSKLKTINLSKKAKNERELEQAIVSRLEASPKIRKNLITQVNEDEVEKITQANLFGFRHKPDASIGNDGTAIEIKIVRNSQSIREIIGQAIAYRMHYRFVILVIIDKTSDYQIVELCQQRNSHERRLLEGLAEEFNVFSVVGPTDNSKNLTFFPKG